MILVTGATGLVGTHLLAELLEKQESNIRAIYREDYKKEYSLRLLASYYQLSHSLLERIHWVKLSILDIPQLEKAMQNVKWVFHCAGLVADEPSNRGFKELYKANVEGTANVVNLSLTAGVQKLCHVSSIATLGQEIKPTIPITETSIRESNQVYSNYSITKYGAEMEVWRASQEKLPVIIVNPGVILGAGFYEQSSGRLFQKIAKSSKFYINKKTGFTDVQDLCSIMVLLMQSPIQNESYIVVNQSLSFKEFFTEAAQQLGVPAPKFEAKKPILYLLWLIQFLGRKLLGTRQQISKTFVRNSDTMRLYSSEKLLKHLDFQFTDLSQSIKRICQHYLQQK